MTKKEIKQATEYLVNQLTGDLQRNVEIKKERWKESGIVERIWIKEELKSIITSYTIYSSSGYTDGKFPVSELIKIIEYFNAKIDNFDIMQEEI